MRSHPDRCAATLANLPALQEEGGAGPFASPGAGSRDCRINLKLLQWAALRACSASKAARARLDEFDPMLRPDLWAGAVQDGVANGFAAALEEAISLAPEPPQPPQFTADPVHTQVFEGRELRRKKDLLVKSGAARIRFSRKTGLHFVNRDTDTNLENCLRFEARRDLGTCDEFVAAEDERPRLFSAQFLQPRRYVTAPGGAILQLGGRLGRTQAGWNCEVTLTAFDAEPFVRLYLRVDNYHSDHRLRARFLGLDPSLITHECTDVREVVANDHGGFVAYTLVRSVGAVEVDGRRTAVPNAQCHGPILHTFLLGRVGS